MKIHEADVVIFQGIFLILVTIYVIFEGLSFLIDYIFPDSEKSDSDAKNKPVEVFPSEKEEIQNHIPTEPKSQENELDHQKFSPSKDVNCDELPQEESPSVSDANKPSSAIKQALLEDDSVPVSSPNPDLNPNYLGPDVDIFAEDNLENLAKSAADNSLFASSTKIQQPLTMNAPTIYFSYDFDDENSYWKILQVKGLIKKLGYNVCLHDDILLEEQEKNQQKKDTSSYYGNNSMNIFDSAMGDQSQQFINSTTSLSFYQTEHNIEEIITEKLQLSSCIIIFLTNQFANRVNSTDVFDLCRYEFIQMFKMNKIVIPILLDPSICDKTLWENRFGVYLDDLPYLDLTIPSLKVSHDAMDSTGEEELQEELDQRKYFHHVLSIHQKKGKFLSDLITSIVHSSMTTTTTSSSSLFGSPEQQPQQSSLLYDSPITMKRSQNNTNKSTSSPLLSLQELIRKILPLKNNCSVHMGQECLYYDVTCSQFMCESCWNEDQENHKDHFILAENAINNQQNDHPMEIQERILSLQSHLKKIDILESSSKTILEELTDNYDKMIEDIHKKFEELIKVIKNQEKEILNNLQISLEEKEKKIYTKLDYLHDLKLRLTNLLQEINLYQTYYIYPTSKERFLSSDNHSNHSINPSGSSSPIKPSRPNILQYQYLLHILSEEMNHLQNKEFPYNISFASHDIQLFPSLQENDFLFLFKKLSSFGKLKFFSNNNYNNNNSNNNNNIPSSMNNNQNNNGSSSGGNYGTDDDGMNQGTTRGRRDSLQGLCSNKSKIYQSLDSFIFTSSLPSSSASSSSSASTGLKSLTAMEIYEKIFYQWILEGNKQQPEGSQMMMMKGPFQLLYQTSRDGFSTAKFHELCDQQGSTLIIIEDQSHNIFGGYSFHSWESLDIPSFIADTSNQSFLFSIKNPFTGIDPMKFPLIPERNKEAIYCSKIEGPIFGEGNDLYIHNDMKSVSFTKNILSYEISHELKELIFTNNWNTTIIEMEIWKI